MMREETKFKQWEDTLQSVMASYQEIDQHTSVAILRRIDEEIHKIATLQKHLQELKKEINSQSDKEKTEGLLLNLERFNQELMERREKLRQEKEIYH